MKLHGSAALTVRQRRRMVSRVLDQGWTQKAAAAAEQVSQRTCSKWVARYRSEGESGLRDRSSAPRSQPRRTSARRIEAICALRRLRLSGPEIAELLAMPASTTSAILKREGLGRLGRIGLEPAERYERSRPGELVHVDIKKLGRIEGGAGKRVTGGITRNKSPRRRDLDGVDRCVIGWDYVHVAVDDYSRLAYAEVLPNEKASTAVAFLSRAINHFARHGVRVERVITDNGAAYVSTAHAIACRALSVRHLRTRPYRPQTNGKACVLAWRVPSGRAARLPALGGLTQAKACRGGWMS